MAKINKIKKNGTTIYPLTIPQAVIDPTTGESVAETLADGKFLTSLEQTTTSTVDGGTNIITATLKDGTTRTFQVKNGNQGNSGYTGAAGELEVVNNLTDGGTTSALSAEQGKTLKTLVDGKASSEQVSQLGQKVTDLDENFSKEQIPQDDVVAVSNPVDGYVKKDGVTGGSGSYINTGEISVSPGDTIACCNAGGYYVSSRFVCAKANGVVVASSGAEYATNYTVPEGVDTVILSMASSNTPLYYRHVSQVDKMTLKPSSIADESVSETKLASSAVTTSKMATSAVSTDKIASKAVTKEKLSDELVAEIESDFSSEYFDAVPGENLLNPANAKVGYWNKGEASTPDPNYRYVKIDISNEPSGVYLWCRGSNGVVSMRFCQFYNGNTFVSGVANLARTEIPSGVDTVYVSIAISNMPSGEPSNVGVFVGEHAWSPYQGIPVAKWTTKPKNEQALARLADVQGSTGVLAGKKWVACGDSFTHGDFTDSPTDDYTIESGKYAGQYKVYPFLIGNRNGMTIVNEAVNGSTLTHIEGRDTAFSDNRYKQIPEDADYITIKIGINDDSSHRNVPIGTISDATNDTFYGAWNVVLDYLIQHHPQAKIGIIVTNGSNLAIVDATIAIAKKWGIAYLNEATDEKCSFVFRSNRSDVVSSVKVFRDNYWHVSNEPGHLNYHPNANAHEYESTVIESWLRTL